MVASEVTVPSPFRLMPISPVPTTSGTIDMGPALRPAPPCCGALPCLTHQTTPAMQSSTTREVRRSPRREPGLAVFEEPIEGASLSLLIGWSMNLPSGGGSGDQRRSTANCRSYSLEGASGTTFERFPLVCRINNRKELHFSVQAKTVRQCNFPCRSFFGGNQRARLEPEDTF